MSKHVPRYRVVTITCSRKGTNYDAGFDKDSDVSFLCSRCGDTVPGAGDCNHDVEDPMAKKKKTKKGKGTKTYRTRTKLLEEITNE